MEPPVVAFRKLKGQFIVLQVVFTYIYVESIRRYIVEGLGCDFCFLVSGGTFVKKTGMDQIIPNVG